MRDSGFYLKHPILKPNPRKMPASLTSLPPELLLQIILSLPDLTLSTLPKTTQISTTFRSLFTTHATRIVHTAYNNEWGHIVLNYLGLGRLLRQLLAVSRVSVIDPAALQDLLERVWAAFRGLLVEETLMPVAVAVARSFLGCGRSEEARALLERVWCAEEEEEGIGIGFAWSVPPGIRVPRTNPDPDDEGQRAISDAYARATSLRRTALYPIGRYLLRMYKEAGYTETDLDPLNREVQILKSRFRRAPVIAVAEDHISLVLAPGPLPNFIEVALLENGVWFSGSGDVHIEGPRDMQDIKALIPITRWGLEEYRFKPAEGDEDAEFVGTTSYVAEGMWGNGIRMYSGPLRVAAPVGQVIEGGVDPDEEDKGGADSIDLLYPLPTGRV
ncbi:hypothetical protein BJX68DRAFT_224303 [Aspergillus pseudodeflectus]|uniref:F-box domain-containing protein n=1 Tax=Aspergillus pseudodeflectus TaxID=176178 RepID=A0ABR4L6X8_9EURO